MKKLTFRELRTKSVKRCNKYYAQKLDEWTPNDWMTALAGEVGELANFLKKIRRGDFTLEEKLVDVQEELADCQIYLDLLAARLGISLEEATKAKFNKVSEKRKCPIRLGE